MNVDQLITIMVQHVLFKTESKVLEESGCKTITNELCALVHSYQKHTDLFLLDDFVAYHHTPCDSSCQYYIPIEDAIPYLLYTVMEYGTMLYCQSLYAFHMLTNKLSRYPTEIEYKEYTSLSPFVSYSLQSNMNQMCCICQDQLNEDQNVVTLPCMHTFHYKTEECHGIIPWLQTSSTCPLCKLTISKS
jgi:Ring finger domain